MLLLLDAPIAVALGVADQAVIINGSSGISAVSGQLPVPVANIALLAVPMFMLMGGLFANSRLARDLSVFVKSLVGWLPAGIGVATVATSGVFANVSGSAVADPAAIGSVYIPEMVENGYKKEAAAAVQAAAGVIGVIFPPAVAMIVFASSAGISVVPVFEAVMIPGLLVGLTNPLQLAVVIGVNSTIGAIMPPVGVGLFVASQIAGVEARSVVRRHHPLRPGVHSGPPARHKEVAVRPLYRDRRQRRSRRARTPRAEQLLS